mgnify:CR=1 FL=1
MNSEIRNIVDYLLLKSSHLPGVGLFHGKMGVAVALFAYANQFNDKLMEEYAWDLLQQVYDGIHQDMPIGLECGLCGIGYGATLLYEYRWVDCELNSILADIDEKIMERDPRRIKDFSLQSGIGGLQLYLAFRRRVNGAIKTFDSQYLKELHGKITNNNSNVKETHLLNLLNVPPFGESEYIDKPIGIDGGSAYYVLKQSLTHD